MPDYSYTASTEDGKIIKGSQFADSESELADQLQQNGLLLIKCRSGRNSAILESLDISFGTIKQSQLIEFCNNMGVMIKAGVPVTRAIDEIQQDLTDKMFKKILLDIFESMQAGDAFHEALAKHKKHFSKSFVSAIHIGERTGKLDAVFFDLGYHITKMNKLGANVRKALIYPCFVLIVMALASYVFLVKVFPPLLNLLQDFDVPLPALTLVIIATSDFLQKFWPLVIGAVVLFIVAVVVGRQHHKIKYAFDWCEFKLPIIKNLFIQMRLAFFMRYMAMLMSAGLDILRGLDLGIESVDNLFLKKILIDCRAKITEGSQFSAALRQTKVVPNMLTRMLAIGETSGNLDEQMELVAEKYNTDLGRKIAVAIAFMEPMLIIMLALLAFVLVMGVMVPMYELVTHMSNKAGM